MRYLLLRLGMLAVMFSVASAARCQAFSLQGRTPQGVTGMATLTLYPSAGEPYQVKQRVRKQQFAFYGTVAAPTVAMLRIDNGAPLYLWIETAEMTLSYNPAYPAASTVTGSRLNSEYRYALEQCRQEAEAHGDDSYLSQALLHYADRHRAAAYVPFLLWLHYRGDDAETLDLLCRQFEGSAAQAYHVPLLRQRVADIQGCREGCSVASVTVPTATQRQQSLDSLCSKAAATFLLVSPPWLEHQLHQVDSLQRMIKTLGVDAQVVWVPLDDARNGWDAPYMQKLQVQFVPYIILLDSSGRILTRDVRLWEVQRLLQGLALPSAATATSSTAALQRPSPRHMPHW